MFNKTNFNNLPKESTPHSTGSRVLIANKEEVPSNNFEALTYGYLSKGEKWEMHSHENIVEICLTIKGTGIIRDENGNIVTFEHGDRFIFPSNTLHEIENTGDDEAQFYFFRLKK